MNDYMRTYNVEDGFFENPVYLSHKRARNWAARLTGKNAANMDREFLDSKGWGEWISLNNLKKGDVLEVTGDYTNSRGRIDNNRQYWRILKIRKNSIDVDLFSSAASALREVREEAKEKSNKRKVAYQARKAHKAEQVAA